MQDNTFELSADLIALKAKREQEQRIINSLPEDESDSPNVCIACQ
jgi:hypothetical protein